MVNIDVKRLIEDFRKCSHVRGWFLICLDKALENQGLAYNGMEIYKIQQEAEHDFGLSEFEKYLCDNYLLMMKDGLSMENEDFLKLVKLHSDYLISLARKQMISEIDVDAMVKAMLADLPSDCTFEGLYRKGIEDTLRKLNNDTRS